MANPPALTAAGARMRPIGLFVHLTDFPSVGDGATTIPGIVGTVLGILWGLAGFAMLALLLFLGVLLISALGFRLRRPGEHEQRSRNRSLAVFGTATVVVLTAALVVFPYSPIHPLVFPDRCAIPPPPNPVANVSPNAIPAIRSSNGTVTGGGLSTTTAHTLLLYDADGVDPANEEINAQETANLISHLEQWTAHPVQEYRSGELLHYDAVVYLGNNPTAVLPGEFLDDVLTGARRVVWLNDNIAELSARNADVWRQKYGFTPQGLDNTKITRIDYQGTSLTRDPANEFGVNQVTVNDPRLATSLATAFRPNGTTLPWAVRAANLLYVTENPLSYSDINDRYLALAGLLEEEFTPDAPTVHRALVRLEDIGPASDPKRMRAIGDYLNAQHVPFSFIVYPVYRDPHGIQHKGKDTTMRLSEQPDVVSAIRYLISCGGTLIMHGVTHQFEQRNNPFSGQSGDDFEFYASHVDKQDYVQIDGPVPGDSTAWALKRIDSGLAEFQKARLPRPQVFEFPHNAGSLADYQAVAQRFSYRYERSLYFPGAFSGGQPDYQQYDWQFFPYAVQDVYGQTVIPENMGYFTTINANHNPPWGVADLLDTARRNLLLRDGIASFFYHPSLGLGELPKIVNGIRSMGYTFVNPLTVTSNP